MKLPGRWVPLPDGSVEDRAGESPDESARGERAEGARRLRRLPDATWEERPTDPRCPLGVAGHRAPTAARTPETSNAEGYFCESKKSSGLPLGVTDHAAPAALEEPAEIPETSNAEGYFPESQKSSTVALGATEHDAPAAPVVAPEATPDTSGVGSYLPESPAKSTGLLLGDSEQGTPESPEAVPDAFSEDDTDTTGFAEIPCSLAGSAPVVPPPRPAVETQGAPEMSQSTFSRRRQRRRQRRAARKGRGP